MQHRLMVTGGLFLSTYILGSRTILSSDFVVKVVHEFLVFLPSCSVCLYTETQGDPDTKPPPP